MPNTYAHKYLVYSAAYSAVQYSLVKIIRFSSASIASMRSSESESGEKKARDGVVLAPLFPP